MMAGQANRIIKKFGSVPKLVAALALLGRPEAERHESVVYRWTMPKAKGGTGGIIPSSALTDVMAAARLQGILITADDLYGDVPR